MKRSGFTMVELIFVIVIIGILAATALPKFRDVSTNANVANFTKIIGDIQSGAVSAYTNEKQLVGTNDINLSDILTISGNGWVYQDQGDTASAGQTRYDYNDTINDVNTTITLYNDVYATANGTDANITVQMSFGTTKVAKELSKKYGENANGGTSKTISYTLD
jgi:MSHA pilin protein MshA